MSQQPKAVEASFHGLSPGGGSFVAPPLAQEDQARADFYALAARLLLAPPDAGLLDRLAGADALAVAQAGHPLDRAWEQMVLAAGVLHVDAVRDEFDALFVSAGKPRVDPYASIYLGGFLMEKPLAALRRDLAELGLARRPGSGELEDHLGALCETMRLMIAGAPGLPPRPLEAQKRFFEAHLAPWYVQGLDDLRRAEGANFYRRVADFLQAFLEVEGEAFEMEEEAEDGGCDPGAPVHQ